MSGVMQMLMASGPGVATLTRGPLRDGSYTVLAGEGWVRLTQLGSGATPDLGGAKGGNGALVQAVFAVNTGDTITAGDGIFINAPRVVFAEPGGASGVVTHHGRASGSLVNASALAFVKKDGGPEFTSATVVRYGQDAVADPMDGSNPEHMGQAGRGTGGQSYSRSGGTLVGSIIGREDGGPTDLAVEFFSGAAPALTVT